MCIVGQQPTQPCLGAAPLNSHTPCCYLVKEPNRMPSNSMGWYWQPTQIPRFVTACLVLYTSAILRTVSMYKRGRVHPWVCYCIRSTWCTYPTYVLVSLISSPCSNGLAHVCSSCILLRGERVQCQRVAMYVTMMRDTVPGR